MGLYRRGSVWWIRKTVDGKQVRIRTKAPDKKTAERIYNSILGKIAEGKFFEVEEGSRRTFAELAEKYEQQVFRELKSWPNSQGYLNQLKEFFGPYFVTQIKAPLVDDFKQFRKAKGVKPATINRQLNIFRRILNLAKKRWMWIKDVPVIEMELKADNKRVRHLSFDEYHKLLSVCDEWLKEIVIVAAWTGLRLGNILRLKRRDVNLSDRTIMIEGDGTKNGERLTIQVAAPAWEVLRTKMTVVDMISPNIFLRGNRPFYHLEVQRGFRKALVRAEINDFRFHDLRHCFATWNRKAGTDIDTLADLLGHKDTRMTRRYAHITKDGLTAAVQRLEDHYQKITAEKKAQN